MNSDLQRDLATLHWMAYQNIDVINKQNGYNWVCVLSIIVSVVWFNLNLFWRVAITSRRHHNNDVIVDIITFSVELEVAQTSIENWMENEQHQSDIPLLQVTKTPYNNGFKILLLS